MTLLNAAFIVIFIIRLIVVILKIYSWEIVPDKCWYGENINNIDCSWAIGEHIIVYDMD